QFNHKACGYFVPHSHSLLSFNFSLKYSFKMSPSTKKSQREAILLLWNQGIRTANEIHARTSIPPSTIYDNIDKLKKTGTVDHARGNGRPRKITPSATRAIGQYIRNDSSISTRAIATKLETKDVEV